MNPSGTGAPFNKRIVWTQLICIPTLYLGALAAIFTEPTNAARTAMILAAYLVAALVVFSITAALAAVATREEPNDERDNSIFKESYYNAAWPLYTGCVLATVSILAQEITRGFIDGPAPDFFENFIFTPLFPAHILMLAIVTAEVVSLVYRARAYSV